MGRGSNDTSTAASAAPTARRGGFFRNATGAKRPASPMARLARDFSDEDKLDEAIKQVMAAVPAHQVRTIEHRLYSDGHEQSAAALRAERMLRTRPSAFSLIAANPDYEPGQLTQATGRAKLFALLSDTDGEQLAADFQASKPKPKDLSFQRSLRVACAKAFKAGDHDDDDSEEKLLTAAAETHRKAAVKAFEREADWLKGRLGDELDATREPISTHAAEMTKAVVDEVPAADTTTVTSQLGLNGKVALTDDDKRQLITALGAGKSDQVALRELAIAKFERDRSARLLADDGAGYLAAAAQFPGDQQALRPYHGRMHGVRIMASSALLNAQGANGKQYRGHIGMRPGRNGDWEFVAVTTFGATDGDQVRFPYAGPSLAAAIKAVNAKLRQKQSEKRSAVDQYVPVSGGPRQFSTTDVDRGYHQHSAPRP